MVERKRERLLEIDEHTIILFYKRHVYQSFMDYLTEKAEAVLFGLLHDETLTWDQFMIAIQRAPEIREIISNVIWWALEASAALPDGAASAVEDKAPESCLPFCRVLWGGDMQRYITRSIHQTERAHFERISKDKGPDYTWAAYLKEVENRYELLCELASAYETRLRGIDFRHYWPPTAVEDARRHLSGKDKQ